jgi:hypothetical protein
MPGGLYPGAGYPGQYAAGGGSGAATAAVTGIELTLSIGTVVAVGSAVSAATPEAINPVVPFYETVRRPVPKPAIVRVPATAMVRGLLFRLSIGTVVATGRSRTKVEGVSYRSAVGTAVAAGYQNLTEAQLVMLIAALDELDDAA